MKNDILNFITEKRNVSTSEVAKFFKTENRIVYPLLRKLSAARLINKISRENGDFTSNVTWTIL